MKKKMILLAAMACILLIGCASDGTGDTAEEQNEKKQEKVCCGCFVGSDALFHGRMRKPE